MIPETITKAFASNQFLVGGALLGVAAGLVAMLKQVPSKIYHYLKRQVITTVEIDAQNSTYNWVNQWLSMYEGKKFLNLVPIVSWKNDDMSMCGRLLPIVRFAPAPGAYIVKYKGKRLLVGVVKEDKKSDDIIIAERRSLRISMLGRKRHILSDFLEECYDVYSPRQKSEIMIFATDGACWRHVESKKPRTRDTLVYDNGLMDRVVNDAKSFLSRRDWYTKMGIPWRRGYLFFGPPGNGKSSLALLLAGELGMNIGVLSLTAVKDDQELMSTVSYMPKGCLLLLEDVDAAFRHRKASEQSAAKGITFSGLLNVLDGLLAIEGRMLVMTTNHKELLDPALIRSGRADVHEYVGNASRDQVRHMFLRFYENGTEQQADEFAMIIPDGKVGMSRLQEFFLTCSTPEMAITGAHRLLDSSNECHHSSQMTIAA